MYEMNRMSLNEKNEVKGIEFCGKYVNLNKAQRIANEYIKKFPNLRTFIEIKGPDGAAVFIRGDLLKNELV